MTEVDSRQLTVDRFVAGRRGIGTQRLQYEEDGSHSVILSERSESKNPLKLRATLQEQRSSNPRGTLRLTRRTRSLRVTCRGIGMARRKPVFGVANRFYGPESVSIRSHPCPIQNHTVQAINRVTTKSNTVPATGITQKKKSVQIRVHPCPIKCDVLAFFAPLRFISALRLCASAFFPPVRT